MELLQLIRVYQTLNDGERQPLARSFLYHEDPAVSSLAIGIMEIRQEVSPNWKKFYEGKIPTREELYLQEVVSSMNYLKLRKVKPMIYQNQQELEKTVSAKSSWCR